MAKYDEGPVASHKSKLNINAPIFLPRNSPNGSLKRTATTHTKQLVLAETDQTAATIKSGQQHIVTDNPIFDAMEQQLNQNDPVIKPTADRTSTVTTISGQQQIVTTTPTITPAERKLLDAMVSSKPASSLNLTALSTGRVNYSRNKMQSILQHKNKAALVNKQDGNSVVIQEHVQDLQNQVFVGRDTYEEGEEDDILNQCRAEATRKGDLSPMHNGKNRKSHTRKNSWDDKVSDFLNVRRLPMRVAKQKKAAPTTSTKSNRSKKKS
ncbi:uncharacterized protein [Nicotiana sylvestris]|uniref:uncharacterized protein isoform X1 n=1 Tax=Nicotiana sylvestris TaxID=4096 RepID=UPI00388C4C75